MNRSQALKESISNLLETDLFKSHGFEIDQHVSLSPDDKKSITQYRKVILKHKKHFAPKNHKRIIKVYKHDGQHYGSIEHQLETGHPVDINYYTLKKRVNNEPVKSSSKQD